MPDPWSLSRDELKCGILHVSVEAVRDQLAGLANRVQKVAAQEPRFHVTRLSGPKLAARLLFHRWYELPEINYGDVGFWRMVDPTAASLRGLIDHEMIVAAGSYRKIYARWRMSNSWELCLGLGYSRYPTTEERQLGEEQNYFGIRVLFRSCAWFEPNDQVRSQLQAESRHLAESVFQTLELPVSSYEPQAFLNAPTAIDKENQSLAEASRLLEETVRTITSNCGEMQQLQFYCTSPKTAERLQTSDNVHDRVWSQLQYSGKLKRNVDCFQTPPDDGRVRVYPLLTAETTTWPEFHFQMSLVHALGQSFVECQALDPGWFDWISNTFHAPLDVWNGPIEVRFGWYGDGDDRRDGQITPHPTDASRRLDAPLAARVPQQPAYLVWPMEVPPYQHALTWTSEGDSYPRAIFRSRNDAEMYAAANRASWLAEGELQALTSRHPSFDLTRLRNFDAVYRLLQLANGDRWRETFEELPGNHPLEVINQLLELLQINNYRIVSIRVDDQEYKRLEQSIAAGNITGMTRAWIEKRITGEK